MPMVIDQFIKQLEESGIVSSGQLAQFLPPNAYPKDAQGLARLLVQSKQLSKYQAQEIYAGRARALLLGNYTIVDKIGAGGMGQVFKGEHRRMKRTVALKMLPTGVTKDAAAVARFQREVEAAARLRHTNIVASDDADEAGGVHFLVMEYVDGKDLAALVKELGPFPVVEAVECVRQAAQGLAYAHKRGVIHRDIKPANLLLDREGIVKILDMGLARLDGQLHDAASVAGLTQSGQVMGTVDYMSPEQAEETRRVDARADQYSLGCSLWGLLTGRPMFSGTTTIAKLIAHRTQPAPSLRTVRADVPPALDQIYLKMVAKLPDERFATMDEVIIALATCLGDAAPVTLGGPTTDSRLTEFFQNIGGVKTAAPPKSVTAENKETQQLQPPKRETGTERKTVSVESVSPPKSAASPSLSHEPTIVLQKPVEKPLGQVYPTTTMSKQNIQLLALATGLAVLLGVVLWFVLSKAEPKPQADPTTIAAMPVVDAVKPPSPAVGSPPFAVAPFDEAAARKHQQVWADHLGVPVEKEITLPGGVKLAMMLIPPGEFLMGSSDEDRAKFMADAKASSELWVADWIPGEGPQHFVRITQPFYLGKYELTQAQWQSLMGSNPSEFNDDPSRPVEHVSWDDMQPFLAKLNANDSAPDMAFVLPTEAQWEYACRAGTTTARHGGESEEGLRQCGWFNANAGGKTQPVGKLRANGFGLYDMLGNVWERCADWHAMDYYAKSPVNDPAGPASGTDGVDRGGSWFDGARVCRSANRFIGKSQNRGHNHGFRLAATIDVAELARQRANN